MGYACPVCADKLDDATALARHLAIEANHDDAHRAFLDEHFPETGGNGPDLNSVRSLLDAFEGQAESEDGVDGPDQESEASDFETGERHEPGVAFDDIDVAPAVNPPDVSEATRALREAYERTRDQQSDDGDTQDADETD